MPTLGIIASSTRQGQATDTGAYFPLQVITVGSAGASSITFSNIPTTGYAHLQLRYFAQKTTNGSLYLRVNGNTTGYAEHILYGNGTSAGADGGTNHGGIDITCGQTSGNFGAGIVDILDYTDTNKLKTIRCLGGYDNNGSGLVYLRSGMYTGNTNAITSITLVPDTTNLVQYSSFALYGIKAAS